MMQVTREERRAAVREGYQILLRAKADLMLPCEKEGIAAYYSALADKCMEWATEVHGEQLRKGFLSMEDTRERARYGMQEYRLEMRCVWESDALAAILCESYLSGYPTRGEKSYHRLSHVWNLEEETILPARQIMAEFGFCRMPKEVAFRPDGVYPEGDFLKFFKNPRGESPFEEIQIPILFKN